MYYKNVYILLEPMTYVDHDIKVYIRFACTKSEENEKSSEFYKQIVRFAAGGKQSKKMFFFWVYFIPYHWFVLRLPHKIDWIVTKKQQRNKKLV